MQTIVVYIALLLAAAYIGKRFYNQIKKQKTCDKCVLMQETKKQSA
jgi:hypothetical protein